MGVGRPIRFHGGASVEVGRSDPAAVEMGRSGPVPTRPGAASGEEVDLRGLEEKADRPDDHIHPTLPVLGVQAGVGNGHGAQELVDQRVDGGLEGPAGIPGSVE